MAATTPLVHADLTILASNNGTVIIGALGINPDGQGECVATKGGGIMGTAQFAAKNQGAMTGTMQVTVYSVSGTLNTNCTVGSTLATSNTIDLSQVTTTFQNFTFMFPTQVVVSPLQPILPMFFVNYTSGTGNLALQDIDNLGASKGDPAQGRVACCPMNFQNGCGSAGICITYALFLGQASSPPSIGPSPYGPNPVVYPCCGPVTQNALQGSYLRAPDVDSLPLIYLFFILLALTLGSYLVIRSQQKQVRHPRQYEIAL